MARPFFLFGWIKAIFFLLMDAFFWLQKRAVPLPQNPKRILVCNTASFGDVVISTIILPVLKERYPESEISFLTSARTGEVLREHPLVAVVHTIDHWFTKPEESFWKSFLCYGIDARRVIKEIRSYGYVLAIDLYPHFFLSALPLLWRARIPVRIGRFTKGYAHLLTHLAPPARLDGYMGSSHLRLLELLGIQAGEKLPVPFYVSSKKFPLLPPQKYIVVHMGTAYALKEWDPKKWAQVVKELIHRGETVVLTGKGERERIRCDQVAAETGCLNLCNQLSWADFTSVVQQAKLLISVDSAALHIASAVTLPCVVLFAGINSIPTWKPPYAKCKPLRKKLPCTPCLRPNGCHSMSCIQEIEVTDVLRSAEGLLKLSENKSVNSL